MITTNTTLGGIKLCDQTSLDSIDATKNDGSLLDSGLGRTSINPLKICVFIQM